MTNDIQISMSETATEDQLEKLVDSNDWFVRFNLAYNSNTPVSVLLKLIEDGDTTVRRGALLNEKVPSSVLRKYENDPDSRIRQIVAVRQND